MPYSPKKLKELKAKRQEKAGQRNMAKHNATRGLWTEQGRVAKRQGKTIWANPYTAKADAEKAEYWAYGWTLEPDS